MNSLNSSYALTNLEYIIQVNISCADLSTNQHPPPLRVRHHHQRLLQALLLLAHGVLVLAGRQQLNHARALLVHLLLVHDLLLGQALQDARFDGQLTDARIGHLVGGGAVSRTRCATNGVRTVCVEAIGFKLLLGDASDLLNAWGWL